MRLNIGIDTNHLVAIDTETTGVDEKAEVVQLAVVSWDERILFNELIKPMDSISEETSRIHHITDELVSRCYRINYYWSYICGNLVGDNAVIGYNVHFDLRILNQSSLRYSMLKKYLCPVVVIDVMQFLQDVTGNKRWLKLSEACDMMCIDFNSEDLHGAHVDSMLTMKLFKKILEMEV